LSEQRVAAGRTSLKLERLLPASIEEVFEAWTDPQVMARWLTPAGRAEVEADVRVGGRLRVVMIGDDMRIEHTGEFLVVDPPRRLSFTWRSLYTGDNDSIVTVVLTPHGESTRLVLSHERLPEQSVSSHEGGWGSMLERLAALLTTPSDSSTEDQAT
jgi:uncharacterized protein YndB with AHSA1/START domain